ncbi:3-methyl-2-oxobutanoate hydroxymethyltransferase [Rhodoferax sp.]|uniref:3-methyl-2-oxobutanoate hydroxymethyltransferase n=1 Tax=Rhodoferax sp. TaxID=50421 RepID=UPI002ACDF5D1|nr:3-methyl-2-oxobutanoate hydroxymethyltransferase [Rhodoferax sp.]MDZ7919527.1 3-methyl-2-oxobutanoate hydroxymethyltransferase [Rhodoferax sp.]
MAAPRPYDDARHLDLAGLLQMKAAGSVLCAVSTRDSAMAGLAAKAGAECLFICAEPADVLDRWEDSGSPGLEYTVRNVACALQNFSSPAWMICELPGHCYDRPPQAGLSQALRLLKAGADMVSVKWEPGCVETCQLLVERGVPVCLYVADSQGASLAALAADIRETGATCVVMDELSAESSHSLALKLPDCLCLATHSGWPADGQLRSLENILGLTRTDPGLGQYLSVNQGISAAIAHYVCDAKSGLLARNLLQGCYQ